jgi:hypothetical protein
MSYQFITPCWNCKYNADKTCKDAPKIQEGIQKCYENLDEHKGSGTVLLSCQNLEK